MKLEKLTDEQKEHLVKKKEEYINHALTYVPINDEVTDRVVEFVWGLIDKPKPTVYKTISPFAAQKKANELQGTKNEFYQFGTYLTIYWQSFYAFYDTFIDFGVIDESFDKYFKLREYLNTGIYATIEFEEAVIICEKPIACKRNESGMHCTDGPAIEWRDGYKQYYINGRNIDNSWFEKCLNGKLKAKDFLNEENDEKRSAAYMILGEEKMIKLLGAELVDEVTVNHPNGESEVIGYYRTREKLNKFKNEQYAWRKVSCPSTGTVYFTPTNPNLKTALDVAKFHRPEWVPQELDYFWFSRS